MSGSRDLRSSEKTESGERDLSRTRVDGLSVVYSMAKVKGFGPARWDVWGMEDLAKSLGGAGSSCTAE